MNYEVRAEYNNCRKQAQRTVRIVILNQPLCVLCVLCVFVVVVAALAITHHRDTKNIEDAQRI
jgi:Fe-S-cluster-containing hydrogenase component 2